MVTRKRDRMMKKINIISILLLFFVVGCKEEKVEQIQKEEAISVSPWEVPTAMALNESMQFVAYKAPEYDEATDIVWSVESPDGAVHVDETTGMVTGMKRGWGKVIATSTISNLSDTSYVIIGEENPTIELIRPKTLEVEVVVGRPVKLEYYTTPYDVNELDIFWYEAFDPSKVKVTKDGWATPTVVDTTDVFGYVIRTEDQEAISAAIRLNVHPVKPVDAINFEQDLFEKTLTEEFTLDFTYLPADANDTTFSYFVSDTTVLGINPENGKIVGKAIGESYVYVSNDKLLSKAVKVKIVDPILAEGMQLRNPLTGPLQFISQTAQLEAVFTPEDTFNKNGTWTSSDESVVTVDDKGLVTAIGNGEATITFVAEDGGFIDTETIEVNTVFYYFTPQEDDVIPNITYSVRDITLESKSGKNHLGEDATIYEVTKTGEGWSLIDIRMTKPVNTDYNVEFKLWLNIPSAAVTVEKYDLSMALYTADKSKRYLKLIPNENVVFDEWKEYTFDFNDVYLDGVDIQVIELVFAHGVFGEETKGIKFQIEGLRGPYLRD
ncbi:Ig domain-containing protein [Flammeovirga sp. OC4]|uniref:Ig-like domain-containing protein n=1 Tax=Flammeovirga sp. OC4 TaxID=1382345 RepID=UPI0005C60EA3|nr:Ig-like domain-containing protein [Flammeovirga sp. OC4]